MENPKPTFFVEYQYWTVFARVMAAQAELMSGAYKTTVTAKKHNPKFEVGIDAKEPPFVEMTDDEKRDFTAMILQNQLRRLQDLEDFIGNECLTDHPTMIGKYGPLKVVG